MELFPCRQHVSEMMYVVKNFNRNRFTHIHEYEIYDNKENAQPSPKRANSLGSKPDYGVSSTKTKRSRRARRALHTPKSEAPQFELAEVLHLLYEAGSTN